MDTRKKTPAEVEQDLQRIKNHMPETYKAIQSEAARIGGAAYRAVRRGCAGEPNAFYAFERGHFAGTRFTLPEIAEPMAVAMVRYGVEHAIVWGQPLVEGSS